jgi:hypothetical protein
MGVYKSQLAHREGIGQPHLYFCDTSAEMPSSDLLTGADILFCHEDKAWYVASSTTAWAAAGGGGEAGGPHTHPISDVTNLQSSLDAKAASSHSHSTSDVTGLQAALDGKSDVGHTHAGGGPTVVKLTADLAAATSVTLANTTGLSFSVTAGTYYAFEFLIVYSSAATTTGLKASLTVPASTVFAASASIPTAADGASAMWHGWITTSGDAVTGSGVQAINTNYVAVLKGVILPSGNGTLQVQHATEIAASGITVKRGSCGILYTL